jgi:hypothetical protein
MELHDECYTIVDEKWLKRQRLLARSQTTMWVTVKGFSIRINAADEGVIVDIYAEGREDDAPMATTYALDNQRTEA